jgi:NACalpha-BTF3-like transcription factor
VTGGEDRSSDPLVGSQGEVDEKDVEILMAQVNCDREKAVKALKESKGDLVSAIMAAQA